MHLSKSGNTYVLKCHCGCYNLSFCDQGVELCGQAKCLICGAAAEWSSLVRDCSPERPDATEPEADTPAERASLP